jgi:hypothetical protein
MDAYFFVRFLRMMVVVFLPIWLISWAVLLPVNRVGTDVSNVDSLNTFTFGNVPPDQKGRYAAHLILAWVFTGEAFHPRHVIRNASLTNYSLDPVQYSGRDEPFHHHEADTSRRTVTF